MIDYALDHKPARDWTVRRVSTGRGYAWAIIHRGRFVTGFGARVGDSILTETAANAHCWRLAVREAHLRARGHR